MYGELFFSGRFSGKREQAIFGFWNSHLYILKKTVLCFWLIVKNNLKRGFNVFFNIEGRHIKKAFLI